MKKSVALTVIIIVLLIPATLYLGSRLSGHWYYLTSTLMIVEMMIPFFLAFETRKPQARELVTLAVLSALAAVSRAVFAFIPHFKPITAIIMMTGIAFGPEAGFLTGAVSAFASNFIFGQGPWTPWQMMSFGIGGFVAGLLFYNRKLTKKPLVNTVILSVFGFLCILLVVGPLLDCCTIFTMSSKITPALIAAIFASGLTVNVTHGISCAVTLLLFSKPLLEKLDRLKTKYGMMEARRNGV